MVLTGLVRTLRVLMDSAGATGEGVSWSGFAESRSLPSVDCCAFCFAAFTLALERIDFSSGVVSWIPSWLAWVVDALELLVAS